MNPLTHLKLRALTALAALALTLPAAAATFIGTDGNWFNPTNWDTGQVPGATNDVVLPAGVRVTLDPALGAGPVAIRDLTLAPDAALTLLPGAQFSYRKLTLSGGTFLARGAELSGDEIEVPPGAAPVTLWFNPTTNDERAIRINANNPAKHTLGFGLAGTTPASPGNTGAGHYARVTADDVELGDHLALELLHGFVPSPGDSFLIIEARTNRTGTFAGLPEGAVAARFGAVDLHISYTGGDGNDVVLTAVASPVNRFTGGSRNWFDALNWSRQRLPAPTNDLLLERCDALLEPPRPDLVVTLADVTLRDQARWELRHARVIANRVDAEESLISLVSSHLTCDEFWDPGGWGGFSLNPSFLEARHIRLTKADTRAAFGLAGTTPAGPGALGPGHYARMRGDWVELDGELEINFLHGFAPTPGQSFTIIEVTGTNSTTSGLSGTFANAPEGAVVARACNVALTISYTGGDGNDVTLTAVALPPALNPLARFTPADGSWLVAANWSCGSVPNGAVDVQLSGRDVLLEPSTPGDTVTVGELVLRDDSTLTLRNVQFVADRVDSEESLIRCENAHLVVGQFVDPGGFGGGLQLNPSFLDAQEFHLTKLEGVARFGIDGTTPAGPGAVGPGHHASVRAGEAWLDGQLEIFFPHGFVAAPGQTYEIITVTNATGLHGTFATAAEGALVARQGNIGFFLSYTGGDGNDVTLTTATLAGGEAPLAWFAGPGADFLTPANWLPAGAPGATTDARLDGTSALLSGSTAAVNVLTLRNSATLTLSNATLVAHTVDSEFSQLNLVNSHLQAIRFRDPGGWGGFNLNPSFLECATFDLDKLEATASFGIDGIAPAGPGALGPGRHARVQTGDARLDGNLEIFFPHGFTPTAGQSFEIITVTNPQSPVSGLHGRFRNVREGDPVARVGDVALFLTYAGGDGNDVVLRAWPVERLENPRLVTGGQFAFDLPTQLGRTHHIESATDLRGPWDIVLSVPGDGATHALLLPAISTAGGRFHRSR